jgi:hypothetical protein
MQRMESIWSNLSANELDDAEHLSSPSILEAVFQLLVMFWTDTMTDGGLESKAIVYFSGVLGIHPYELAYRTAYDYTPYLSALLWVGRLVVLEYALPLQAYTTLDVPFPARSSYIDQGRRLCVEIRPIYLQRGSFSPIGYLIERLQHGRAIAKREGPRTNISWSFDGQTLDLSGTRITMQEFRQTIHSVLTKLEITTRHLMFDW